MASEDDGRASVRCSGGQRCRLVLHIRMNVLTQTQATTTSSAPIPPVTIHPMLTVPRSGTGTSATAWGGGGGGGLTI